VSFEVWKYARRGGDFVLVIPSTCGAKCKKSRSCSSSIAEHLALGTKGTCCVTKFWQSTGAELDRELWPTPRSFGKRLCKISEHRPKQRSAQKDAKIAKIYDLLIKAIQPGSLLVTRCKRGSPYHFVRLRSNGIASSTRRIQSQGYQRAKALVKLAKATSESGLKPLEGRCSQRPGGTGKR
jgi:hypothetical protein